jgi:transglutaminase/protease-like cytokinesis protein 3
MKKMWACIVLLITAHLTFAQARFMNFARIDQRVSDVNADNPDTLAHRLTANYTTDLEKVRAIFSWITEHISYRTKGSFTTSRNSVSEKPELPKEDTSALKPLDVRVAENVLQQRTAVCDGYSRLFKTLCDFAGIQSEVITGYARGDRSRISKQFRANHTWNAVLIDSNWHLMDVTWASGFIAYSTNDFVKSLDESYFLAKPEAFIYDHYPEDLKWTLLSHPPTLQEFYHTPFKHTAFVKYNILSFKPAKGVIDASVGDSIRIELETLDADKNTQVYVDNHYDSTTQLIPILAIAKPTLTGSKNKIGYTYRVESGAVEWLNIVYNDEVIMQYKLNIKDPVKDEK